MQYYHKPLQENEEIPFEYVFNDNKKSLQWAKKNLDNIEANVNKKNWKMFKIEI